MNLERHTSPLTKSWLPAIKGLVAMCIFAPFAALMLIGGLQNGETALTVIGGIFSLGALIGVPYMIWDLFVSPRGGYGQCPVCFNSIEAQSGDHQDLLCAGCGAYLDAKIDRLETIEPGRTTDKPFFAAPTPWPEVRGVVSSTVAFSAFDYAQDKLTELMMSEWTDLTPCVIAKRSSTSSHRRQRQPRSEALEVAIAKSAPLAEAAA